MRTLLRKVEEASVDVRGEIKAKIGRGILVYAGFSPDDSEDDYFWMVKKLLGVRIFEDLNNEANHSVSDLNLEILIVSQFTLFASLKKGYRPSFHNAAPPEIALQKYNLFNEIFANEYEGELKTGIFGAEMKIRSIDYGPFSLWLDSKSKNY